MKIIEYPTLVNRELRCDNCGCKFTINRQDAKKKIYSNIDIANQENKVFVNCPCCKSGVSLDTSVIGAILSSKYDEINKVFKNKAVEISKSDKIESRQEVFRVVDDLYNAILDIENN